MSLFMIFASFEWCHSYWILIHTSYIHCHYTYITLFLFLFNFGKRSLFIHNFISPRVLIKSLIVHLFKPTVKNCNKIGFNFLFLTEIFVKFLIKFLFLDCLPLKLISIKKGFLNVWYFTLFHWKHSLFVFPFLYICIFCLWVRNSNDLYFL